MPRHLYVTLHSSLLLSTSVLFYTLLYTQCRNRDRVNLLSRGYHPHLSLHRLGRKLLLYNLVLRELVPPLRPVLRNSTYVLLFPYRRDPDEQNGPTVSKASGIPDYSKDVAKKTVQTAKVRLTLSI
jgi:hypothetical protein